jgi:carbon-monoxide dehydrogenase medium subunit
LPSFDYVRPGTIDEAVGLLQERGEAARLLMGGTDLFPGLRDGLYRPKVVVDVKGLPGMSDIRFDMQTGLSVGAAVTMNALADHPDVQAHYPLLAEAAGVVASYQVRNRATLGGNLCNASPCADTAPATLVLEAGLDLYGPSGQRTVRAGAFFVGPGQTVLQPGELLTAIRFPPPPADAAGRYLKLGRCRSGDLALVGVAVLAFPDGTRSGYKARIGLGSVAPTAVRVPAAEEALAAMPPGEDAFALAAERAMELASPISDVRGSASYQKAMVCALTLRCLRDVWTQMKEGE